MQPLSPDELTKYARQFAAEKRILARARQIAKQVEIELARLSDQDRSEREKVLKALAYDLIRNLREYSVQADLSHTSWITRNILELETVLAFVTTSPQKLTSFLNDVVLDEIQIRETAVSLNLDRSDPETARRQGEALERLRRRKAELQLTRNRPMSGQEMADAIGADRRTGYRRLNKFCSQGCSPYGIPVDGRRTRVNPLGGLQNTRNGLRGGAGS